MDSIKHSLVKVMSFYLRSLCKVYNIFSFCSVCLFGIIFLTVSGTMYLVEAKKFLMVGYRWKLEVGANRVVNKVS